MTAGWTRDPATWPPERRRDFEHWIIERDLRGELLAASPETRDDIFRDVYDRLYRAIPWHPGNHSDHEAERAYEEFWFRSYGALSRPGDTVVDLGCGHGALVRRFATSVARCVGLDASDDMIALCRAGAPPNADFVCSSVIDPPLPDASADLAISRQVTEHLHPDDLPRHLRSVLRILRPGGRFLIETPSRLTGPWDVSRGFTAGATGFHLREYTNGELAGELRRAGFARVRTPLVPRRLMARLGPLATRAYVPAGVKGALERIVGPLPESPRRALARAALAASVLLVAERP